MLRRHDADTATTVPWLVGLGLWVVVAVLAGMFIGRFMAVGGGEDCDVDDPEDDEQGPDGQLQPVPVHIGRDGS